jgi:hypothetical protein
MLRGHWFHITVLNVHTLTENKTDDVKASMMNWNVYSIYSLNNI